MITLGCAYNEYFTHKNNFSTLISIRAAIFREKNQDILVKCEKMEVQVHLKIEILNLYINSI